MSALSPFRVTVESAPEPPLVPAAGVAASPFLEVESETWLDGLSAGGETEAPALEAEGTTPHPLATLYPLPTGVLDALSHGLTSVAVSLAAAAGYREADHLTDVVFYFRHPDRIGHAIRPDEHALAQEWIAIREQVVRPALQSAPAAAPTAHAPVHDGAALSSALLQWPEATPEQLAFMRAVYDAHAARSQASGRRYVSDLPPSELAPVDGHQARHDAAEAAARLLAAAQTDLATAHAAGTERIGIVSAYRPATLQFQIWQGRMFDGTKRSGGFPAYYRRALSEGVLRPGDYSPHAVETFAHYLGRFIASPGYSNHQDGLAFDFGSAAHGHGLSTIGWTSWFRDWLVHNARRFGFAPLESEPWHWTYTPGSGSSGEISSAQIRAGRLEVDHVPLLAHHHGSGPDLVLCWNDMASAPDELDIVVHLHGYWYPRLDLRRDIEPVSGLQLTPPAGEDGQGRTRPTLTILPRGHDTGVKQAHGPYDAYTFPALTKPEGLPALVRDALDRFATATAGRPPRVARLILTAHSGGGQALLEILRHHDPHQVHVFDALYWPPGPLLEWARRHVRADRAVDDSPKGALRVYYQGRLRGGTRPNSLAVLRGIADQLDDRLTPWYRVEASEYGHFEIPRRYGWRLLADASTDVPGAHSEQPMHEAEDEVAAETDSDVAHETPSVKAIAPVSKADAEYVLWVLDDVLQYETSRLFNNLSDRWRTAFDKLFSAIHDRTLGGRTRRERFDEAILTIRGALAYASDDERGQLSRRRADLLLEEAMDRIKNSVLVGGRVLEIPDEGHPREQARVLHEMLPTLVQTLAKANEQRVRLYEAGPQAYEHAIEAIERELEKSPHRAELEELIHHLEQGKQTGERLVEKIGMLQAFLETADGWLALQDEELRERLSEIHGSLPAVESFVDLVKAITQIGMGSVSITAAFAGGLARLAGDTALAEEAFSLAGQAGVQLGNVVAAIEIVHGILVLCDSSATAAEKEDAVVGIASGGSWFIGRYAIGEAAVGGAASFALAGGYLLAKAAGALYWQGALGINSLLMRETFDYLRDTGTTLARVAGEVERGRLLLRDEHDPIKSGPLSTILGQTESMLATMLEDFLDHARPRGAKDMGFGGTFPTAPGNVEILAEAFAPLQRYRGVRTGTDLVIGARAVAERIAWCLVHAREIEVASTQHKHFSDVEHAAP